MYSLIDSILAIHIFSMESDVWGLLSCPNEVGIVHVCIFNFVAGS